MPSTSSAHPRAMQPKSLGKTRTAPPMKPASWKSSSRMRLYTLFGLTGWVYLLASFVAIRIVWALGDGPERWAVVMDAMKNPIYIAFHLLCLVSVIFVLVRFFGLFPKAQPAFIGPIKPPPQSVLTTTLYVAWLGLTVGLGGVLAGVIF